MAEVVWRPDSETIEHANATRLLRRAGMDDWWALVRRSAEDPDWFWPLVVDDLKLEFSTPFERVYESSRGPEWTTWFVGGRTSIARNCVHRWAERRPDAVACLDAELDERLRETRHLA